MIFESYHGTSSGGKSDTSWTNTWELENRRHGVVLTGITSPPCPGAFLGKMSTWCCPVACAKLCKSNTTNMRWKFLAETQLVGKAKVYAWVETTIGPTLQKQTLSSLYINFEWNSSTNWTFFLFLLSICHMSGAPGAVTVEVVQI
jgi:hypothetical protein